MPDAPPAIMPSAAVGGSSGVVRASSAPASRLAASVAKDTSATGSHEPASSRRASLCRYAPSETPAIAWLARNASGGTSSASGRVSAIARPSSIAAKR